MKELRTKELSETTQLAEVECDYIFTRYPTKEDPDPGRLPADYRKTFKRGEFQKLVAAYLK